MSVSTEEAEECARGQDSIEEASKFLGYRSIANRCAATLRALAAERDALKAEIEKLRAALQNARRNALEEAAKWHDEKAQIWQNTYAKETLSSPDMQPARIQCLERYGFHIIAATDIRALGEKE